MTALAPGAALDRKAVTPYEDPTGLRLSPSHGPRPDAVSAPGGPCQIIELFPGAQSAHPAGEMVPRLAGGASVDTGESSARMRHKGREHIGRRARLSRRRAAIRLQLLRLWIAKRVVGQQGMATAEYAIATLGAVAFAGLLVVIMRSDEVRGFLLGIIRAALALP